MSLFWRQRRYSQPFGSVGINWRNPLTHGLQLLVVGGSRINSVTQNIVSAVNGPTRTFGPAYLAGSVEADNFVVGSSQYIDCGPVSGNTLTAGVIYRSATTSQFVMSTRAAGNTQGIDMLTGTGTNNLGARLQTSAAIYTPASTGTLPAAYFHHFTATYDSAFLSCFADGAQIITPVSATGTVTHASNFRIGNKGTAYFTGSVALAYFYNRALSQAEVFQLQKAPWQLFAPGVRRIFIPSAAGGGNIAVPAASLALTAYAPTVTSSGTGTSIAVPAASLALTAYAPSVSIQYAINSPSAVPTQVWTVGVPVSLDVSPYFYGDFTPFSYTYYSRPFPAGTSINASTGIISGTPTTAASLTAYYAQGSDAHSNVAYNSFSIQVDAGSGGVKTIDGLALASVKTVNGLALASMKTYNGIAA